jgi:hypothetical protein
MGSWKSRVGRVGMTEKRKPGGVGKGWETTRTMPANTGDVAGLAKGIAKVPEARMAIITHSDFGIVTNSLFHHMCGIFIWIRETLESLSHSLI